MNDESYDDLDEFGGEEFAPQPAIRPGLDTLPDGAYEFEILDAELTRAQNGDRICNLGLRVDRGAVVQHTYWLTRQVAVNRLAYDLGVLGIDTDGWGKSKGLGESIAAAVDQLAGLKFKGTKTSRDVKGTNGKKDATYHDLNIAARVGGKAMPTEAAF